jgi:hypothetical protein
MVSRARFGRAVGLGLVGLLALVVAVTPVRAWAQDDDPTTAPIAPEKHGRKYKAPPETSHIEVTVLKGFNKKPIDGAHVIFHPVKDGVDEGNLEVKTHEDGKATIDVIPTGSAVRIQVLADGFATFADDYTINEASREIVISMVRPQAQVSTYIDNSGKPADLKPGVQEPARPKLDAKGNPIVAPAAGASGTAGPSTTSGSSTTGTKPQP